MRGSLSQHQPVGRWIRPDKRLAIYLRDHFVCGICGDDLHDAPPADVTLDHVVPRSRGGSNHESNLYTCCRSCNSARGEQRLAAVADAEAIKRIRRVRRRSLTRYRKLAKAILEGRCPAPSLSRS